MYLAARMARKSWINSKYIRPTVVVFSLSVIANQILGTFCSIILITGSFKVIILTLSFIIATKQCKKLIMVLNWTTVDLHVSRNEDLLKKQVKMLKKFKKLFTIIWIGTSLIIISEYMDHILFVMMVVLRKKTDSNSYISLCEASYFSNTNVEFLITILFRIRYIIVLIGILLAFSPYIGYGLSTMSLILFRLYKGQTGYRTQFKPSQLNTSLI